MADAWMQRLVDLISRWRSKGSALRGDDIYKPVNKALLEAQAGHLSNMMNPMPVEFQRAQFDCMNSVGQNANINDPVSKGGMDWGPLYKRNLRFLINAYFADRYIVTAHATHLSSLLLKELRAHPRTSQGGA